MDVIIGDPSGGGSLTSEENSYGDSDVRDIQEWLNDNYGTNLDVDGIAGKDTFERLCS